MYSEVSINTDLLLLCFMLYLLYVLRSKSTVGAAHGIAGILQMLLCVPDYFKSDPAVEQDIHTTVDFMLSLQQVNGNVAPAMDEVRGQYQRSATEELIHWCHGAPGEYLILNLSRVWTVPHKLISKDTVQAN